MKKNMIYAAAVALLLLLTLFGCSKEDDFAYPFTTNSVLTMVYEQDMNAQTLKGMDGIAYNPTGFRSSGDTLFIANRADGHDGVLVVRASTGEVLKALTSWEYQGATETFDPQVMDVAVNAEYIFVVNRSSRIDMFRRNDYSYVTTIGKTGWKGSALLQCESAEVVGDKLFIRDKRQIKVVNLSDCTPENRFKVPVFAESKDSTAENTGFAVESVMTYDHKVYVTDYKGSNILVIDPATVQTKGEKIAFLRSYRTPSQPLGMDVHEGDLFVTCANNQIVRLDMETGQVKDTYSSFAGTTPLGLTSRIRFSGESFYLTGYVGKDLTAATLKRGKVMFIDFSELDQ